MASISINCFFFPQAFARPRNPNPNRATKKPSSPTRTSKRTNSNRSPKFKPQKSRFKPAPQPLTASSGGEATTYTCLPPKEDFEALSSSLPQLPTVIKLSQSRAVKFENEREEKVRLGRKDEEEEKEPGDGFEGGLEVDYERLEVYGPGSGLENVEDEEGEDSDGFDNNLGEDYERLEVYEAGSDLDEDEEGEEEEEEEEESEDGFDGDLVYEPLEVYEAGSGFDDEEEGEEEYEEEEEEEDEDEEEEDDKYEYYEYESGGEEGIVDGEEVKDKGVPAVMRCFDRAKVYVKSGDGGNGVMAFRREKYVPFGGPSGGNGGKGGNVYVEVDDSMNSLLPFRNRVHYRAGRGAHGQGSMMDGQRGEDVVVKVPPGTVVREAGNEEVLLELLHPGQKALVLPGGRGGRGNAAFKSGSNKVPKIAENGEEGSEMWLELELKLVADVGIVGAPNAGKSTLLSVISAAKPAIANYPFTTLLPNLGVVSFDYDSTIVVADLPGLLEGAHRGFGLGHEFLRHTERCSALVHVVDGSSEQPELEFDAVRLELELFSPEIADKPYVVAFNKMDLPEANENWPSFMKSLQARGIKTFCMSAVKQEGTRDVISAAYQLLQRSKEAKKESEGWVEPENLNHVADTVEKQRRAPIDDFEIFQDGGSWHVVGSGLQRFVQMTNWRYKDSDRRFQHVLEACGVYKSLLKLGVKEGDTVIVAGMELVWHDYPDSKGLSNMKKKSTDSIRWPQWQ